MRNLKLTAWLLMFVLASVGCASPPPVPRPPAQALKPSPPPAWMMAPAPDLMLELNSIISISEPVSKLPQSK